MTENFPSPEDSPGSKENSEFLSHPSDLAQQPDTDCPEAYSRTRLPHKPSSYWKMLKWTVCVLLFVGASILSWEIFQEVKSSHYQAHYAHQYSQQLTYTLQEGKSPSIYFPKSGPYDIRLGYTRIPYFVERLEKTQQHVEAQAILSNPLLVHIQNGLNIPYKEKSQAGLTIWDCNGRVMYQAISPAQTYKTYKDIPPIIVQALLFIENKNLLDPKYQTINPAIDWPRFCKAALFKMLDFLHVKTPNMGGSTIATQIEKFRHSENGATTSIRDKINQILSASIRAYHDGEDTSAFRNETVLSYLNSVPLSAVPGLGEVNGLGDGLSIWLGINFDDLNRILSLTSPNHDESVLQGKYLKSVISLMVAQRRPSYYLLQDHSSLDKLANSYLRLLENEGFISREVSVSAQNTFLALRKPDPYQPVQQIITDKGTSIFRNKLCSILNLSTYEIDKLDLGVTTSIDSDLQTKVDNYLQSLHSVDKATQYGLIGKSLLTAEQVNQVTYSFTLHQRTPNTNMVRVQTDTLNGSFDINEGSKLELGSTAKLRTLVTYLEILTELYLEIKDLDSQALDKYGQEKKDVLSKWMISTLTQNKSISLPQMLESAMMRQYSTNPSESFFTGGGMQTFSNFNASDNNKMVTVAEALQNSLNLPFVRILHDIVNHIRERQWSNVEKILTNDKDPRRQEILDKFIDKESKIFLSRFWSKYSGKDDEQNLDLLIEEANAISLVKLTVIFRFLYPEASFENYRKFLDTYLASNLPTDSNLLPIFQKYSTDHYSTTDLGYLITIHPLELWIVKFLREKPNATLKDAIERSFEIRHEMYSWLQRTKDSSSRNSRIKIVLENEAFQEIHRRWQKYGYPFDRLVPSLATALGSSGDKPSALAELVGILLNKGSHIPTTRFPAFIFAEDTPFETRLSQKVEHSDSNQVMNPEVAAITKKALRMVVSEGTAKRLSAQANKDMQMEIGGKTGTGDNRIFTSKRIFGKKSQKTLNRTATFVFYLGNDHFGTITAFVNGKAASNFSFTSTLPLQVLKGMTPILSHYIKEHPQKESLVSRETYPSPPQ